MSDPADLPLVGVLARVSVAIAMRRGEDPYEESYRRRLSAWEAMSRGDQVRLGKPHKGHAPGPAAMARLTAQRRLNEVDPSTLWERAMSKAKDRQYRQMLYRASLGALRLR